MEKDGIMFQSKNLALLRRIMSKRLGHIFCLNCCHSFATENRKDESQKSM